MGEPWDSPHNRKLIPRMPSVYQNPSAPAKPGMAHYVGLVGKGTFFEGTKGRLPIDVTDGFSNTLMLVEVNPDRGVIWTKPDDLPFDPDNPLAGLGKTHDPQGFLGLVLRRIGSVYLGYDQPTSLPPPGGGRRWPTG